MSQRELRARGSESWFCIELHFLTVDRIEREGGEKVISQKAMAPGDVKIQKDEKNNYSRMASSVCGVPC